MAVETWDETTGTALVVDPQRGALRPGERVDLVDGDDRPFGRGPLSGASDAARVLSQVRVLPGPQRKGPGSITALRPMENSPVSQERPVPPSRQGPAVVRRMHCPGQWVKGPLSVVYDSLSEITVYDFEPVPVVPDVEPFSMWTRPDRVLSSQSFVSTMRSARPSRV